MPPALFIVLAAFFMTAQAAEPARPTMAYVLQADSLGKTRAATVQLLADCGRDWIVIDYMYGTGDEGVWTSAELKTMRAARPGRKIIAYLSIGEAEAYRKYWQKDWAINGKPGPNAPAFLGAENPEWKGNYRVKYWHADWQRIMLQGVDEIVAQGFDGLYLDIVDGFEFFEEDHGNFIDNRKNPDTSQTYRQDMIQWVGRIAEHGRRQNKDFLIIPQNGSQLLRDPKFTSLISAIGIEDLFTNGNKLQPKSHWQEILTDLKPLQAQGKPVLLIEYPKQSKAKTTAYDQAQKNGLSLLVTDRQLKTLGETVQPVQ